MIKLLATDLDGTLFYPKRRLTLMTRANKDFLRDFYHAGGKVVLVTGRSNKLARKIEKSLKIKVALLGCAGAFIYEDGKTVDSHPIDRKTLMELYINVRAEYGIIGWMLFDDDSIIKIAPTDIGSFMVMLAKAMNVFNGVYSEQYLPSETAVIESIAKHNVYKLSPVFGVTKKAIEKASAAYLALSLDYRDRLTINKAGQVLEITAGGVNKAKTLQEYMKIYGIKDDEVAVAGDSFNDLTLFDHFSNSFAMESGQEVVKSKASHIIKTVSDIRPFVLDKDNHLI